MNKDLFLSKASETNCFISESKILSQLAGLGKAVIISMDHLEYFSLYFLTIKEEIAKLKQSQLYHIEIVNDGQYSINSLGEGCLSLEGVRPCTRYQEIEVDYLDQNFKKHNI